MSNKLFDMCIHKERSYNYKAIIAPWTMVILLIIAAALYSSAGAPWSLIDRTFILEKLYTSLAHSVSGGF